MSHIFGVYKHKNFKRSVNIFENKFIGPNKQFFVYLQEKLGANKHFYLQKKLGANNNFWWGGGGGGGGQK